MSSHPHSRSNIPELYSERSALTSPLDVLSHVASLLTSNPLSTDVSTSLSTANDGNKSTSADQSEARMIATMSSPVNQPDDHQSKLCLQQQQLYPTYPRERVEQRTPSPTESPLSRSPSPPKCPSDLGSPSSAPQSPSAHPAPHSAPHNAMDTDDDVTHPHRTHVNGTDTDSTECMTDTDTVSSSSIHTATDAGTQTSFSSFAEDESKQSRQYVVYPTTPVTPTTAPPPYSLHGYAPSAGGYTPPAYTSTTSAPQRRSAMVERIASTNDVPLNLTTQRSLIKGQRSPTRLSTERSATRSPTSDACDPAIEEHFRRSLGQYYHQERSSPKMSPKTSPRQSPKASYISATRHHVRRKNSLKHARSEMGTSTRIQLPVRVKQEVGSPEEEMAVLLHDGYSNHSNHSTHVSQAVSSESLITSLTASVISSQPSDVKIPPQATAVRHVKVPTPSALLPPPYKSKNSSKIPLHSVRTPQEAMETILIVPKSCVSNKFHPKTELGRVIKQENSTVKKNPSRTVDPLRVTQKMYTKPSQTPCVVTAAQSVKASDEIPTKVVVINSTTPTSITGSIDDHFAKSLGSTWTQLQHSSDEGSTDAMDVTVEDHFAKALGETWEKINAKSS